MQNTSSSLTYERFHSATALREAGREGNWNKRNRRSDPAARSTAVSVRQQERAAMTAFADPQAVYQARRREYRVRMARQYFLARTTASVKERAATMPQNIDPAKKQKDVLRSTAFWSSSMLLASAISYGVILILKWISTFIHTVR